MGLLITGDTKPAKDVLKSLGGRWTNSLVGWRFPGTKHSVVIDELRKANYDVTDEFIAGSPSVSAARPPATPAQSHDASATEPQAKKQKQMKIGSYLSAQRKQEE